MAGKNDTEMADMPYATSSNEQDSCGQTILRQGCLCVSCMGGGACLFAVAAPVVNCGCPIGPFTAGAAALGALFGLFSYITTPKEVATPLSKAMCEIGCDCCCKEVSEDAWTMIDYPQCVRST